VSTEIYGSRYRSGEIVGIDLSAFLRAFAGMIVLQEEGALGKVCKTPAATCGEVARGADVS